MEITIVSVDSAPRLLRDDAGFPTAKSTTNRQQLVMKMHRRRPEAGAEIAQRRICESEVEVARQRELLVKLRSGGQPTERAEELLKEFEVALRDDRRRLSRMASSRSRNRPAV